MLISNIAIYLFNKFDHIEFRIDLGSICHIIDYKHQKGSKLGIIIKQQVVNKNQDILFNNQNQFIQLVDLSFESWN